MKYIKLTQNKVAIVDDDMFEPLNMHKWCAHKPKYNRSYYAVRSIRIGNGKRKWFYMHREVLPDVGMIDHINGNGLDNRLENLRPANFIQNGGNRRKSNGTFSSKFKGVRWNKANQKWLAQIKVNGKQTHLGSFDLEVEAAKAYNKAAIEGFGKYAKLNEV